MTTKSGIEQVCLGFIALLAFVGVVIVFYFSWLPDPVLSKYDLLPDWLARWTDAPENDTIRTAVPFMFLGMVTGCYFSATRKDWRWWMSGLTGLMLIVFVAEAGQLLLPHRSFDWNDIAWGIAGSLGGLALIGSTLTMIKSVAEKIHSSNRRFPQKNRL